jgi:hypothetical protein
MDFNLPAEESLMALTTGTSQPEAQNRGAADRHNVGWCQLTPKIGHNLLPYSSNEG